MPDHVGPLLLRAGVITQDQLLVALAARRRSGGTLAGVLGALLAIPTAAGLLLLYEEVLVPRQQQH